MIRLLGFSCLSLMSGWLAGTETPPMDYIKGVTISCQGSGRVWGTDAFADELDKLKKMGVTHIAIHPYAGIRADGTVSMRRWKAGRPPRYIVRPIEEAKRRGLAIMIKPHLAYWGSPFKWRGDIHFRKDEDKQRFYRTYREWIVAMARLSKDADVFAVGTELEKMQGDETQWREIIAAVRRETRAELTYAANWDCYQKVPFWDALDLIGIQGYFPISSKIPPEEDALLAGWRSVLDGLKADQKRFGKPVVFTEFGYNRSYKAAMEPWDYRQHFDERSAEVQARCLRVGLEVLAREKSWFRGVFLWKWFVGSTHHENFLLNEPRMERVIQNSWRPGIE